MTDEWHKHRNVDGGFGIHIRFELFSSSLRSKASSNCLMSLPRLSASSFIARFPWVVAWLVATGLQIARREAMVSQLNELHAMPGSKEKREKLHWVIKALIKNAMEGDNVATRTSVS